MPEPEDPTTPIYGLTGLVGVPPGVVTTKVFTFFDGTRYRATFKDGVLLSVEDMPPADPEPAAEPAPPETWHDRPSLL